MDSDKQLLIDSQVEEYEISLRNELDKISQAGEIAEKTSSFRETLLKKELSDLERDVAEIRREEHALINWNLWLSLVISLFVVVAALVFTSSVKTFAVQISYFMT